jgi:hypothetical protein
MACRHWKRRLAGLVAGVILAGGLCGCSGAKKVTLTNVSESWLNVRFFVGRAQGSNQLASKRQFQIKPGETAKFAVSRKATGRGNDRLVHMMVENVTPSWDGPGKQHWMELLTEGSIKVVVRGKGDDLEFETGDGQMARIPNKQLKRRFQYKVAGAPSTTTD